MLVLSPNSVVNIGGPAHVAADGPPGGGGLRRHQNHGGDQKKKQAEKLLHCLHRSFTIALQLGNAVSGREVELSYIKTKGPKRREGVYKLQCFLING